MSNFVVAGLVVASSLSTVNQLVCFVYAGRAQINLKMCKFALEKFCFICGKYSSVKTPRRFTEGLKLAYLHYFGFAAEHLDDPWTPDSVCNSCSSILNKWNGGNEVAFLFAVPMLWRSPIDHVTDCYFCLTEVSGGRHGKVTYPSGLQSVSYPVPHLPGEPKPECPTHQPAKKRKTASNESNWSASSEAEEKAKLMDQAELNDLCRDLRLSKRDSELLASRLKRFLAKDTRITIFRTRSIPYAKFYVKNENFCYCKDITGLFAALGQDYNADDWRLFIDGSKYSVKAVLLNKGNNKPSIPIVHAVDIKESYDVMKKIIEIIDYKTHNWKICCDLKVVGMLTGLQGGYTKFCCFLCLWDSRARNHHYSRLSWPERTNHVIGSDNINYNALVTKENVILPPLHIKLGLMKNFVKALGSDSEALVYLKKIFPKLSTEKIKEGVFVGPQIKKLFADEGFAECLSRPELKAWKAFQKVVDGFLGNNRSPDYRQLVNDLIHKYRVIGKNLHEK